MSLENQHQTELIPNTNSNTNELNQRNNREAICGRILRLIGDELVCKVYGHHLRRIADQIYYRHCAREIAQCLLHELAALDHGDLTSV